MQAQPVDALRKPRADPAGKIALSSGASSVVSPRRSRRQGGCPRRRRDGPPSPSARPVRRPPSCRRNDPAPANAA
jgi:hypothetical protein